MEACRIAAVMKPDFSRTCLRWIMTYFAILTKKGGVFYKLLAIFNVISCISYKDCSMNFIMSGQLYLIPFLDLHSGFDGILNSIVFFSILTHHMGAGDIL